MRIRKFRKEDAIAISDVIKKGWLFNNSSYYSAETLKEEKSCGFKRIREFVYRGKSSSITFVLMRREL
ncbi:hypothetical protein HYU94_02170 [Candidatus Daviesbacteria bacterium]|nr:hypothetical protein [Candidatus Daviesbacteria bacterium]